MSLITSFDINKYQKKLGKDAAIFCHGNHVDIFQSEGWENHTRFLKVKTPNGIVLRKIDGQTIPNTLYKQVLQEVK